MKDRRKFWAYFDTSVFVKRYVQEDGTDQAKALLTHYRFVSSRIAIVEALSTFRRRRDSRDLDARHFDAILKRFDADTEQLQWIEPTREVLERAGALVRQHKVGSLDAIHIASTLCFCDLTNIRTPFVTADENQRSAAAEAGLELVWVA